MSKREHKMDAFLSSMSFAKNMADCDCDECGFICEVPPPPIRDAVNEHKKRKLLEVSPSQERSLISRDGGISMWKFTMPPGSQPLTEYGNSHRFIFVKNLPKGRIVKSIGEGIIGSSSEEKSRKEVSDWNEGGAIFFKSNGGKALGWLNEIQDADKNLDAADESMNVIIYTVKATDSALEIASSSCQGNVEESRLPRILSLFQKYLSIDSTEVQVDDALFLWKSVEENLETEIA